MADDTNFSSKDGKNLQWMYDGTKSMVNREDYLLGKKVDKNFELYSDVVIRDQEEEKRDAFFQNSILKPSTSAADAQPHKVSALDTRIVRTEDPLVALKYQEEQRRRQILENPLLKLKAQRVLRKAFEKELKRANKKSKRKKRHSSSESSSPSSSPARKREAKGLHHHRRETSDHQRKTSDHHHRRETSGRRQEASDHHYRRKTSDHHHRQGTSNHYHRRETSDQHHRRETSDHHHRVDSTKPTAEELEERRRAMLANATWRDEMRERNLREAADKLSKEQDEMSTGRAGFMRTMMSTATEGSSIEKRLQSNRMNIQRQHDHMEKSFVKK